MGTVKRGAAAPKVPKVVPEKIHILHIAMVRGSMDTTEKYLAKPVQPARTKVDYGQQTRVNWEAKTIYARLFVEMEGQDEKGQPLGVGAAYAFEFVIQVDNLEEFTVTDANGQRLLHGLLGNTLMGIMFSTTRGMILERTKGTYLAGTILPVIAPRDLLVSERPT